MRYISSPLGLTILMLVAACSDNNPGAREAANSTADVPCNSSASVKAWEGGMSDIFKKYCASCHPGTQPTDYSTYKGVRANIAEEKRRIDDNTMPPGGGISAAEKEAINAWINAKMPEKNCT